MSLRVLTPGTYSLLVDAGRPRTRGLGVAVGGPADAASIMLGNALAGNAPFATALEITLSGPTLLALADVGLCVFGAPFQLLRDGDAIPANQTFTLNEGQTLRIGATTTGCRAYLCVRGGFRGRLVLGSATAFEPVKAGDKLECAASRLSGRSLAFGLSLPDSTRPLSPSPSPRSGERGADPSGGHILRCLPGPQCDWFDDSFFAQVYRVTPLSNRMGTRLEGPALVLPKRELVSEPVAPGAIQITNDGQPIVLGVDGQTIGGYPKIAHVISADLDSLGQLRPGDEVRCLSVSEEEAESASATQRTSLRSWRHRIETTCRD